MKMDNFKKIKNSIHYWISSISLFLGNKLYNKTSENYDSLQIYKDLHTRLNTE